jgi:hypothetical protein
MSPLRLILCSHVSPNRHQKYLTTRRRQRHSAYLWVIDLYRWGRRIFEDPAPMAVTRAPSSGFIIGIGSLYSELHPNRQYRSGYSGCYIHPPALGQGIELIHIDIIP